MKVLKQRTFVKFEKTIKELNDKITLTFNVNF